MYNFCFWYIIFIYCLFCLFILGSWGYIIWNMNVAKNSFTVTYRKDETTFFRRPMTWDEYFKERVQWKWFIPIVLVLLIVTIVTYTALFVVIL